MGTITAATVISRVSTLLQDPTNIRWPQAELLNYLNDGQFEIALYKPNACVKNEALALAAGAKQSIPTNGTQLIEVIRNRGTSGTENGKAIRLTMREILDAQDPAWYGRTAAAEIQHYTYNPLDPKTFYVYPPSTSGNKVEVAYAAAPEPLSATTNTINVDDVYFSVLVDYMMYRAYSKDSEYAADAPRAEKHQRAYLASLTGKVSSETGANPNSYAAANPNVTPVTR